MTLNSMLDDTTLSTISLLEARLLRIEHLLYGKTAPAFVAGEDQSVRARMLELEKRFAALVSNVNVYNDVLQYYKATPALFNPDSTTPNLQPSHLPDAAVLATVIASVPSFVFTVSTLVAAVQDNPIPRADQSAAVVVLRDRIRAAHATQVAQAAEVSRLRARSEALVRRWYDTGVLGCSGRIADADARLSKAESALRRRERAVAEDKTF